MRGIGAGLVLAALAATAVASPVPAKEKSGAAAPAAVADPKAAPDGLYVTDPAHRTILFSYQHQGYSVPYVRWREWTGKLKWNATKPEQSFIQVDIDASKVDSGVDAFDGHLKGEKFFDVAKHPTITFVSTSLKQKGPNTGTVTGNLTIKGVTKPATLDVTLNKAALEQRGNVHKIGFSGKGVVKRSDWGLDAAVPFVSDEVTITVEAEFVEQTADPAQ